MLQYVAVRCNVLQRSPTVLMRKETCLLLQCVAVRCSVLQCVAVCCLLIMWSKAKSDVSVYSKRDVSILAVCCSVLQYVAVCCSVLSTDHVIKSEKRCVCVFEKAVSIDHLIKGEKRRVNHFHGFEK